MYKVTIEIKDHTPDTYIVKVITESKKWFDKLLNKPNIHTVSRVTKIDKDYNQDALIGFPIFKEMLFDSPQHAKEWVETIIPDRESYKKYLGNLAQKYNEAVEEYAYHETVIDVK